MAQPEVEPEVQGLSSDDSDEIDAEISRLEEEVDTDEDADYPEDPNFEPTIRQN